MNKKLNLLFITFLCVLTSYSQVDYESDILPIFEVNCTGCHGFNGSGLTAGLDLTNESAVLNSGVVIEGDFTNSTLYDYVDTGYMPPSWSSSPDLNMNEVNLLVNWIDGLDDACSDPNACNYDSSAGLDFNFTVTSSNQTIAITDNIFEVNDIIGVFFQNINGDYICAGSTTINNDGTFAISAFQEDIGDDGFSTGEPIVYFLNSNGSIYELIIEAYNELLDSPLVFTSNGMSQIAGITIGTELTDSNDSCEYSTECIDCDGLFIDANNNGVGDCNELSGCVDAIACNYDQSSTQDDGTCIYLDGVCETCSGENNGTGIIIDNDSDSDGVCNLDETLGCTDISSCTYNELATDDDGSCDFLDDCGVCGGDDTDCIGCADGGATEDGDGVIACNYSGSSITIDDGSCEYLSCAGCNDELACNYNPEATISDDSCDYSCIGCLDENACNYCDTCVILDNSCEYQSCVPGCTDESACNYNPNLTVDDGSCVFLDGLCETCENGIVIDNDADDDGVCNGDESEGCVDVLACNYNVNATEDDGLCQYINENSICDICSGEVDGSGVIIDNDSDNDGECDDVDPCPEDSTNDSNNNGIFDCEEIIGCTDSNACNYDSLVNTDDGSCQLPDGCTDILSCNYDENALCDDSSCVLPDGCTNLNACNYNPSAICDDGSCESISCIGCLDPLACNYCIDCTISLSTSCDYNTCCNDPSAANYDPNCTCVDNENCFTVPDDCNFNCFQSGEGIYPIPITSSYGAYELSCYGANDGFLAIDFNTMNLVSAGVAPYSVQVYQQIDSNNDGLISEDEEIFIGTLTEDNAQFNDLIAANYILIAYDFTGCCGQTLVSLDEPGQNTLSILEYNPILCPGGETEIGFIIDGAIGQFDIVVDDILYEESVEGGTITINATDSDNNGIPEDFIQLNTNFYFNENFWPTLYNECDNVVNTIYINIENDENIEDGDLIGAFYTDGNGQLQCFGYNVYTSSSSGSSLLTIQICDGDDNGFNNGEEVIFLVYDESEAVVNEVNVLYEYNNNLGVFSDVFTFDSTYDGIWIASVSVVGESGNVPNFSLIVSENSYNIQVSRADSIDSDNDGVLDDAFICSVIDTVIVITDPNDMAISDFNIGGSVCSYIDDSGNVQSTPSGFIQINSFSGGTSPYNYTWYDSSGNLITETFVSGVNTLEDFDGDGILDDLDFLSAGFYNLSVLDFNNCEFDTVIEIISSQIELSELEIIFDPIACFGGETSVQISFDSDIGNAPFSYSWSNSGGLLSSGEDISEDLLFENVIEGTYVISISDNTGCSITQDIEVFLNPSGQIAIFSPFIDLICDADDAYVSFSDCPTLDGSCITNGNAPFEYSWYLLEDLDNDGLFDNSLDLGYPPTTTSATLNLGTYSFEVTDSNGCSGQSVFTLSAPEPIDFQPTIDSIVCYGDFATISLEIINGNPGLYDFMFEGDTTTITIGGSSDLDFSIDDNTGLFDASLVTDVNATLLFNDVSIFSINDTIGVFYTGDNGITCGGSAVYQGESVFSIAVWGDDSSSSEDDGFESNEDILILLNTGGDLYELDVIDYNNLFDSPYIYAPNAISAITDINIGSEFLQGPNFITGPLLGGDYLIEVVDGNECYWSDVISVQSIDEYYLNSSTINPSCDLGGSGEIDVEVFGGTSDNGYSFIWTSLDVVGFSEFSIGSSDVLTELIPGQYDLVVLDGNDCILQESFIISVYTNSPEISIVDELCGDDGEISVCVDWVGELNFTLSNNLGNESNTVINSGGDLCYDFSALTSSEDVGSYTLSISTEDESCDFEQENIFISPNIPITVEFVTESADCDGGYGSIWITLLEGGNPPYEIDWQGLSTESTPVGSHSFIITDSNGCEYNQNYVIQNGTSIEVDVNIVDNSCYQGSEASLSFEIYGGNSSNYSYFLTGPNSLSDTVLYGFGSIEYLSDLESGVYNLFIEDELGCVLSLSESIIDLSTELTLDPIEINQINCFGGNGTAYLNVNNDNNNNYIYHWYELEGPNWDVDNDGVFNSDDLSIDGGDFISTIVGFDDLVILPASNYFVFVESILTSCTSDTILFLIDTPISLQISVSDVYLDCNGDITSVSPIIYGGSDSDIDNDGVINNDEFGNWVDLDIDGDGQYDIDGECILNCNDDDSDIDNDGILNEDDDYIGGTIFNGISTDYLTSFSNGLIWENQFGVEVDPQNLIAGTYNVFAYDSNGCLSNVEEFSIIDPDLLDLDIFYDYNAIGSLTLIENSIDLLCFEDEVAITPSPFGGTPPYNIVCLDEWSLELDLESQMLSSGDYIILVVDSKGCEISIPFVINNEPNPLDLNLDLDGDGENGVLEYNNFNISCNGYSDGMIEYLVPSNVGTSPYNIEVFFNGELINNSFAVLSNSIMLIDNLTAGIYEFIVIDFNGCTFEESVELIEPDLFELEVEYVVNASCDEEEDGVIIIRTSGGNPPLSYTIDGSLDILTTSDSLLYLFEDEYVEEISLTESDILLTNLDANSYYSINIINDSFECLTGLGNSYTLYVGSDDSNCLFVPSVFTPNGDGINDTWQIDGIELYSNPSIMIYNRWGALIYESLNQEYISWDGIRTLGSVDSDQEIATYYYVIELNVDNKNYNGSVTIKR